MRFGIAIPGCIALCQPIFIIFANNWFGLNIRQRHSTFSIFEIWNLNIQITGCKFAHPVLPPARTPSPTHVPLSVALAPMRPTYFAYGLTPRNPFPFNTLWPNPIFNFIAFVADVRNIPFRYLVSGRLGLNTTLLRARLIVSKVWNTLKRCWR